MPTYKQVVNHVKKHVLWKEEYFERYYQLNDKLVQKRLDEMRLMNFRRTLSARDPDSGFYHEASDSFLAKNQTVNFLQIFPRQRGVKITVVLPDYTECLIYQ